MKPADELDLFDGLAATPDLRPYQRLALALVAQAAIDATGPDKELSTEARDWLTSSDCGHLSELLNWQDDTLTALTALAHPLARQQKNSPVRPQKAHKGARGGRINKNQGETSMNDFPHLQAVWATQETALREQAEAEDAARQRAQDEARRAGIEHCMAEVAAMYERMEPDYTERQELIRGVTKTLADLARLNRRLQTGEHEARRMLTAQGFDVPQVNDWTTRLRGRCPLPYDTGTQPSVDDADATATAAVVGVLRGVIAPHCVGLVTV